MAATMKEIAYMCGVSRGTVDRVLNNRGNVKEATAERIRSVAKSIGYIAPSSTRPVPRDTRTIRIGILVNAIGHSYFSQILSGMMKALEGLSRYQVSGVVKLSGGFDVDQQIHLLDELLAQNVNGLAITPVNHPRVAEKLRTFTERGIPVVCVSALISDFDYFAFVGCEHYLSGRIAGGFARKLLPAGGKVALLTSHHSMISLSRRLKGFVDALNAGTATYDVLEPVQTFDDDVITYKGLSDLIQRHKNIDLFFFAAGGYNGGFQALQDGGLLGKRQVIAFDAPETNIAQLRRGNAAALFNQHPTSQGRHAIKCLADYLLYHQLPEKREQYERLEILIDESFYSADSAEAPDLATPIERD